MTPKLTVTCPACGDPIHVTAHLTPTGETKPSEEQPNPEGGTRDLIYDLRLDTPPITAHLHEKHADQLRDHT